MTLKNGSNARSGSPKPGDEKMSDEDRRNALARMKSASLLIGEVGLKRIADHKYKGGVYTPMDNLFNTCIWTPLSKIIPPNIAPNTITVTGLGIQIIGYCLFAYYCPDFKASPPQWVYAFSVFTIICYQTFDALDGKQARQTGTSSPLGQLFDHGCDSVVTVFLAMLTAMCLHLGFSFRCITLAIFMLLPFWLCQWTEYHAETLPTSIAGIIGVTEAQVISMFIVGLNMYDIDFWTRNLGIGEMPHWWCGNDSCPIALNDCVVFIQTITAIFGMTYSLHTVHSSEHRKAGMGAALLQVVPVLILTVVGWAWAVMIPQAHPRLVLFTLGISFSHQTCKMIVAAMSKIEYKVFQPELLPLPILFVVSLFRWYPNHDEVFLGAYAALTMFMMYRWVSRAIQEISMYLGINTFSVFPREKPKAKET